MIGFLTILGYSLYDTVVVFDKVRENTQHVLSSSNRTFAEAANLAVNQTLVRSINTSVVALLPVASILFIVRSCSARAPCATSPSRSSSDHRRHVLVGLPGPAAVRAEMREREPDIARQRDRVLSRRSGTSVPATAGELAPPRRPPPLPAARRPRGRAPRPPSSTDRRAAAPAARPGGSASSPRRPGGRRR